MPIKKQGKVVKNKTTKLKNVKKSVTVKKELKSSSPLKYSAFRTGLPMMSLYSQCNIFWFNSAFVKKVFKKNFKFAQIFESSKSPGKFLVGFSSKQPDLNWKKLCVLQSGAHFSVSGAKNDIINANKSIIKNFTDRTENIKLRFYLNNPTTHPDYPGCKLYWLNVDQIDGVKSIDI